MRAGRRPAAVAVSFVLAGLLGLAGCGGSDDTDVPGSQRSHNVSVDTPALRAQKATTDIAPCPASDGTPAADRGLPDLTLPCLGGGRAVNLAGLTGQPMIVNVWAQWCGPCRAEAPALESVYQQADGRFGVVGIDWQDTQPGAAIAFADELGLTYPQVADPDGLTRAPLRIAGPPMTLFVDKSGSIAYVQSGAISSASDLRDLISEHLGIHV